MERLQTDCSTTSRQTLHVETAYSTPFTARAGPMPSSTGAPTESRNTPKPISRCTTRRQTIAWSGPCHWQQTIRSIPHASCHGRCSGWKDQVCWSLGWPFMGGKKLAGLLWCGGKSESERRCETFGRGSTRWSLTSLSSTATAREGSIQVGFAECLCLPPQKCERFAFQTSSWTFSVKIIG